jgi:hypothetical protein
MTSVAVMVVLSSVPSTRLVSPLVTALFDARRALLVYMQDDISLMVTLLPADVNRSQRLQSSRMNQHTRRAR